MADLTNADLDVLIEAVEAWESKDSLGEFMGDMVEAMVGPREGPEREEWLRKRAHDKQERQQKTTEAKRVRKERSILLRAKLIALRDRAEVDDYGKEAMARTT